MSVNLHLDEYLLPQFSGHMKIMRIAGWNEKKNKFLKLFFQIFSKKVIN